MMVVLYRDNMSRDYLLRVGQDREVKLSISVTNNDEEAHEATVSIEMPPAFQYLGTDERVYISVFTILKAYMCLFCESIVTSTTAWWR